MGHVFDDRMNKCLRLGPPLLLAALASACAAAVQRPGSSTPPAPAGLADQRRVEALSSIGRPTLGVAFGGGSARGIAHVGVLRWFDEHRIPIDVAAGTSMGGLIGGSFATGMDPGEIAAMLDAIDWDTMFGTSNFAAKNIRRKSDNRAFPSRLEFGLRRGIVPPTSLNNGEQVELLISRITAPYSDIGHFDELPTPFRSVAVDLVSASEVVLDRGSLARALRATMSLPLIFPPVELDGRVLVDGGAMNNVPADVVKAMGADRVVAINVGDLSDREALSRTALALAGATLDAMMRASTNASIGAADVVVHVPLQEYGSLDWRRAGDLMREGYAAAEAMRDALLPLAVSDAEYARWREARQARRRQRVPVPAFVTVEGFARNDARRLNALLPRHVGVELDVPGLEADLGELLGLDRYETIGWSLTTNETGDTGLLVTARLKAYAPPFMMLGLNVENVTGSDFRVSLRGRYLAYGPVTSGSELRIDATVGSLPAAGLELYQPIGPTPLFVAPYAGLTSENAESLGRDVIVARYDVTTSRVGLNLGANLGTRSDVRAGVYYGRVDASLAIGDPSLPELRGSEGAFEAVWRFDGQDSPVIPTKGTLTSVRWLRVLDGPDGVVNGQSVPIDGRFRQLSATVNRFWSLGERNRLFAYGGLGTSFGKTALPMYKFNLGSPLRLGAYRLGELRASNYYVATAGYLRRVGRMPDFIGGPVFAGGWVENGDAVEDWDDAVWRTNASVAVIMDTLLGPVMVGGSAGFDGRWRTYIGVGRIFR